MRTQTKPASPSGPGAAAALISAAVGLGLYLLTLAVEVLLGASTRWLLIFLGISSIEVLLPLGLCAQQLAWFAAAAPLAYSTIALIAPGRGSVLRRRLGARRLTAPEAETYRDAITLLRAADPELETPLCFVLDDPLPNAVARGRVLLLSRALLQSDALVAVIAHELGHLESLDARLTEAIFRLRLWPRALYTSAFTSERRPADHESAGGLLWLLCRTALSLALAGPGPRVLAPLWAAYWRAREYAADLHAADLGQAFELASHLTDYAQALDAPRPGLLLNRAVHPPVALRIERLLRATTVSQTAPAPSHPQ